MGIIINFFAIICGGIFGLFVGNKFSDNIKNIIMDCAGVFIIISGIKVH